MPESGIVGNIFLTSQHLKFFRGLTASFLQYGLRIDYSGSSGERSGTEGWEYIHILNALEDLFSNLWCGVRKHSLLVGLPQRPNG
jgi:hypothetical protein